MSKNKDHKKQKVKIVGGREIVEMVTNKGDSHIAYWRIKHSIDNPDFWDQIWEAFDWRYDPKMEAKDRIDSFIHDWRKWHTNEAQKEVFKTKQQIKKKYTEKSYPIIWDRERYDISSAERELLIETDAPPPENKKSIYPTVTKHLLSSRKNSKRSIKCIHANVYSVLLLNLTYDDWRIRYPLDGGFEAVKNQWEMNDLTNAIIEKNPRQLIFCGTMPRPMLNQKFVSWLKNQINSNQMECTFVLLAPTQNNFAYFKDLHQTTSNLLWNEFYETTCELLKLLVVLALGSKTVRVLYTNAVYSEDIYLLDIKLERKTSIVSYLIGDPLRPIDANFVKGADPNNRYTILFKNYPGGVAYRYEQGIGDIWKGAIEKNNTANFIYHKDMLLKLYWLFINQFENSIKNNISCSEISSDMIVKQETKFIETRPHLIQRLIKMADLILALEREDIVQLFNSGESTFDVFMFHGKKIDKTIRFAVLNWQEQRDLSKIILTEKTRNVILEREKLKDNRPPYPDQDLRFTRIGGKGNWF